LDGSTPKPAQQWDPWKLLYKVEEWVKAGINVYSCYEAGPCLPPRNRTRISKLAAAEFAQQMLHMPGVVHSSPPFPADTFQMAKTDDDFHRVFGCDDGNPIISHVNVYKPKERL
jgi:hypothetical protein